jgi:tRNA A-37 threonylcarbamoyl transferase component Bud32
MTELTAGTVIAGKYRLLERLSEGGMGSVWLAHHLQLDARVALKFMQGALLSNASAHKRFEREARAAARIRSPHVVTVHDVGVDETLQVPFIVMEVLRGEDLAKRIAREGCLAPDEVLRIVREIAKGLGRAHESGIVHRDLKPANVFLCSEDDDLVKLLDFGIAKDLDKWRLGNDATTAAGQVLGSPQYMSPEQVRSRPVDHRADLWALGVIAFRALTGMRPFDAEQMNDLIARICSDPVPSARKYNSKLPASIDSFFAHAFERDPADRFQSAEALVDAFGAALQGSSEQENPAERASGSELAGGGAVPAALVAAPPAPAPYREPLIMVPKRDRIVVPPERPSYTIVLAVGVILAVALIFYAARRPGDFNLRSVAHAFQRLIGKVPDVPRPTSTAPAGSGSAGLVELDARAEKATRELYRQVRLHEIAQAVETLSELLEVDPQAPVTKRGSILQLAEMAIDRGGPVKARMLNMLTDTMGQHGPDLLFDLLTTRLTTPASREAERLLRDPALRKRGSRDMQLAYAIYLAPACRAKWAIIAAKKAGGPRTLRTIDGVTDCESTERCCLKSDATVTAVAKAIRERPAPAP